MVRCHAAVVSHLARSFRVGFNGAVRSDPWTLAQARAWLGGALLARTTAIGAVSRRAGLGRVTFGGPLPR